MTANSPLSPSTRPDLPLGRVVSARFAAVRAGLKDHNIPVASAWIAFWALLALAPTFVAVVSIYGLIADPDEVRADIEDSLSSLPEDAQGVVAGQLEDIAATSGAGLGVGVAVGIVAALWSASGAVKHLVATINQIHGVPESRGFVSLRGRALLLTLGGVLFVVVAATTLAVVPALLGATDLGGPVRVLLNAARFPLLAVAMVGALLVLYRVAPNRPPVPIRTLVPGAAVATVVWLALSGAFSVYTASFATYNETYGTLGAIVVLLLWLYLTAFSVLLGAEVNAAGDPSS